MSPSEVYSQNMGATIRKVDRTLKIAAKRGHYGLGMEESMDVLYAAEATHISQHRHSAEESSWLIQHLPHFVRHCGRRKRFQQKRHVFIQHALMDDGILGIGRGEKNPDVRV
jgi:hypothetical protein